MRCFRTVQDHYVIASICAITDVGSALVRRKYSAVLFVVTRFIGSGANRADKNRMNAVTTNDFNTF